MLSQYMRNILCALFLSCISLPTSASESITLGANAWMPYVMFDDGKPNGIAVNKVQQIADRLDYNLTIQSLPFKRVLRYVEDGKIDGVLVAANREERQKYLAFTKPIFCERRVFITKEDAQFDWHDPNQLQGKRLGVGAGFYIGKHIQGWMDEGRIPPVVTVPEQNLLSLVQNGRLDFILYSEKEFLEYKAAKHDFVRGLKILDKPLNELTLHLGFSLQNKGESRRDEVDKVIEALGLEEDCNI